jgi:hypothetical protein
MFIVCSNKFENVLVASFCSVILGVAVTGCGGGAEDLPALGEVTGKVTLNGQPLVGATVIFTPGSGPGSSTGVTNESGEYKLVFRQAIGAVVGSHKVAISKLNAGDPSLHDQAAGTGPDAPAAAAASGGGGHGQSAGATRDPAETIASKYNDATELTAEVKTGINTFDFELTSG